MAIPVNITDALAFDLGSLPANVVQQVDDAGVTYDVWYFYDAIAGDNVIGLWGFGGAISGGYEPTVTVWTGVVGSLVQYIGAAALISSRNKPIQFPVIPGTRYYFKFTKNGNFTPSNLTIDALDGPAGGISPGDIFINDDTGGFPAAILSSANGDDYNVIGFIQGIVAGEAGEQLDSNRNILLTDDFVDFDVKLYDANLALLLSIALPLPTNTNTRLTANQLTSKFYVGTPHFAGAQVSILNAAGAILDTQTLSLDDIEGLAASLDDSILYTTAHTGTATNKPVKRWDLVAEVFLSDLAVGIANYAGKDVIVLLDGTILVAYNRVIAGSPDVIIKRYDSAGATLNTYNVDPGGVVSQIIATALDNPLSFWVWVHDNPVNGISKFLNIRVSDGVVLSEVDHVEYELGVYNAAETTTPLARFGNSFSCPFLILRDSSGGTIVVGKVVNPAPDSIEFVVDAGGGLDPTQFTLVHGGFTQYNNVPAGEYSIIEVANPLYVTTYFVSNGSPYTNISVADGETVTIVITNTLITHGGIYKIQPGKRNDTLWVDTVLGTTVDVKIPNPVAKSSFFG